MIDKGIKPFLKENAKPKPIDKGVSGVKTTAFDKTPIYNILERANYLNSLTENILGVGAFEQTDFLKFNALNSTEKMKNIDSYTFAEQTVGNIVKIHSLLENNISKNQEIQIKNQEKQLEELKAQTEDNRISSAKATRLAYWGISIGIAGVVIGALPFLYSFYLTHK